MSRRFRETEFTVSAGLQEGPALPGFMACPTAPVPPTTLQLWHAMYQYAFAQALAHAIEESQPTKYQRLVWRVSLN